MSTTIVLHSSSVDATDTTMTEGEGETATIYQELLSFLSSPRNDLQKAAAEATLAALTPSTSDSTSNNEAAQSLTTLNVIRPLCKIASISSQQTAGSNDALCALNILCSHQLVGNQCILDFLDCKGIGRCIELALSNPPDTPPSTAASISALNNNTTENGDDAAENSEESKISKEWNEWRKQVNYACALLANATRDEKGAVEFIGQSFPNEAIPSSFMQNSKNSDEEEKVENDTKDTTKPTAMLLLSRFLNPLFIDTSSSAYKTTVEAWEKNSLSEDEQQQNQNNKNDDFDEYDAFDQEDTHTNEATIELQKAKQSITMDMNEHYDPYQHIAAVIMNITQLESGRKFLMKIMHSTKGGGDRKSDDETTSHLQSLLPQLSSPNTTRRQGIAGTLKNCCFATDSIWWLLNVVNMDKSLLMTLAGPEELTIEEKIGLDPDYWLLGPQKVREPNVLVRLYVVEAILLLLASGRRTRETLRERRTYVIIKLADMVEESEEVSERLLECVQYLRRDEEGTEEGSSDKRAYETYARGLLEMDGAKNSKALLQLPPSTTAAASSGSKGDDEEDYENID